MQDKKEIGRQPRETRTIRYRIRSNGQRSFLGQVDQGCGWETISNRADYYNAETDVQAAMIDRHKFEYTGYWVDLVKVPYLSLSQKKRRLCNSRRPPSLSVPPPL